MRLILVGGDKVAYYLVRQLIQSANPIVHDRVTVIEQDAVVAQRLADELGVSVVLGDGTNRLVLQEAGCEGVELFVALTGRDEHNLMACQLARHAFGVKTIMAKINNPKNREVFERLGIAKVFSSAEIIAAAIDQEIEHEGLRVTYSIPENTKTIVEFVLSADSEAVGRSLSEHRFPAESRVVLVTRTDGRVVMPTGDLVMAAGDRMLMVCDETDYGAIMAQLIRPAGRGRGGRHG